MRCACMSHPLSSGKRCYVVLGVIVAALSLLAAFQNPVKKTKNVEFTSKTKAERIACVLHKIFRPKFKIYEFDHIWIYLEF